jgi:hypothetical protein
MRILVDRIPNAPTITYEQFLSRVNKFRTSDVLKRCNGARAWLEKRSMEDALLPIGVSKTYLVEAPAQVYLSPSRIAFIAKSSILRSSENRQMTCTDEDFKGLVYMQANMVDAFTAKADKTVEDKYSFLIRMDGEQSPYQDRLRGAFARSWMMHVDANRSTKTQGFDLEDEWKSLTGLDLGKFILIGFNYFSGVIDNEAMVRHFASSGIFAGKLTQEECERFLAIAAATPEEFREESKKYQVKDPLYIKSEFNLLWRRPLIAIGSQLLAPLPILVANRVSDGLRFDLRESMREEKRNPFSEYFGKLFEVYVGRLLEWTFGADKVHYEPQYGKPIRHGPDWVVLDGDTAILIECRTSALTVETRALAKIEDVRDDIRRMFVETLSKYPGKIAELRSGAAGLDFSGVKHIVPLIVSYDRVCSETVYRDVAKLEFAADHREWFDDYELMGVEDLELLSAWHSFRPIHKTIAERKQRYPADRSDVADFLNAFGRENSLPFGHPLHTELLDRLMESAFNAIPGGMPVDPAKLAEQRATRAEISALK